MSVSFDEAVKDGIVGLDQIQDYLEHVGVLHKSGRYPWGSGENGHQRHKEFLDFVDDLKRKGLSDVEIAAGLGLDSTTQLRAKKTIAKSAIREENRTTAVKLHDKGMSNVAIGKQMGLNESSVRNLLDPAMKERNDELVTTANMLRDQVAEKKFIDIGAGVENHLGISQTKLNTAVAMLEEEGYTRHKIKVQQLGTGKETTVKVLAPPGTEWTEVVKNPDKIQTIHAYSEDGGRTFLGIKPPESIKSKRVGVRYAEEGGAEKDGVIELRRGVDDISLGNARYAQVRIAVDGTHYLKGMAMYSDDLPDGVDMMFNTNKTRSEAPNKLDAMKPLKKTKDGEIDPDNPFGATIRQRHYLDKSGKEKLSVLNIVGSESPEGDSISGEEGGWSKWSAKLSSQMLSKQTPALAKEQLDKTYALKKAEFDEINSLTNPAVKRKLLQAFAESADSSAVHLKAAGLQRTAAHVILPINSLKDNEIYAPQYNNGEKVVLIRHPHGGTFEIPELTVNNRNKQANSLIKNARDAVGINHKVAARLSGADFDGDTVLVIPNDHRKVKTSAPLESLKDFDPKISYKLPEGQKFSGNKQQLMGDVSNLITDMTIKGASHNEIARAVKHSMVVIDAEKHDLDYKRSAIDNGIKQLKKDYQGKANGGASTLISKASSDIRVPYRKPRPAKEGGPIDKETGKLKYVQTGEEYVNNKGKTVQRTIKSKKMAEVENAFDLVSDPGTVMESVYANHANRLKSLANDARKTMVNTPSIAYSPSAKTAYANEVATLNAKLNIALKNSPRERQAQLLANTIVKAKRQDNPDMDKDDLKKVQNQALAEARLRVGAKKQMVEITPPEWEAIQAGAITNNKLNSILDNADVEKVKELATPRKRTVMTDVNVARAKTMLNGGATPSEVAVALGVPVSTLNSSLKHALVS